jgi:bacterioferritin
MPKASPQFIEKLNEALTEELASVIQYLWDHILARGMDSLPIAEMFKGLSMIEMKHAYTLAERIDLLGGVPTTSVGPIKIGGDLRKMVDDNLKLEYDAIEMYKKLIRTAEAEDDPVTRRLLEDILKDTEEHANTLETVLGTK